MCIGSKVRRFFHQALTLKTIEQRKQISLQTQLLGSGTKRNSKGNIYAALEC